MMNWCAAVLSLSVSLIRLPHARWFIVNLPSLVYVHSFCFQSVGSGSFLFVQHVLICKALGSTLSPQILCMTLGGL